MVSSPNPERNILWCLSSDPFPFHPHLVEAQSIMPLDGPAWALAEIRPPAEESQPPLAVRQHAEPPAKYIILTPQVRHFAFFVCLLHAPLFAPP